MYNKKIASISLCWSRTGISPEHLHTLAVVRNLIIGLFLTQSVQTEAVVDTVDTTGGKLARKVENELRYRRGVSLVIGVRKVKILLPSDFY